MNNSILCTTSSFSYKADELILNPHRRKLTEEELLELIQQYQPEALIAGTEPITGRVLGAAKNLRVISRVGVGMDNVDHEAAKARDIKVFNTPDAVTPAVAEFAVALMLNLLRNISLSDRKLRDGEWVRPMGNLLKDKIVGIIGYGRIGSYVAKLCRAFQSEVLAYDPIAPTVAKVELVDMKSLLTRSDIVTLHLPANSKTQGFFNANYIGQMRHDAFLINTSRGGIVDEETLYTVLKDNKIAGAAIDVFDKEPYTGNLKDLDNVVLTAHMGGYAKEARMEMERQAYDNVMKVIKGDG